MEKIKLLNYKILFLVIIMILSIIVNPVVSEAAKKISEIQLNDTKYIYTGSPIYPIVTVKYKNKVLRSGTDYTIKYSNNTKVGTATVTVKGKGKYSGTKTKNFTIAKRPLSDISLNKTSYTYTGNAIKPIVTAKYRNQMLTKGKDYKVEYSNNTNAGLGRVIVTGIGNYAGTRTITFNITKRQLPNVSLNKTSYTYTGNANRPSVIVKCGNVVLRNGVDYIVNYSNNVNAGKGKVTVTGKKNYTGTRTITFNITKRQLPNVILNNTSYTYTGNANRPSVMVKYGNKVLKNGTDYTVNYSNNVNVGTGKVTITGKGNYTGTQIKTFKIGRRAISNISLDKTSYTYTGNANRPSVTVKHGNKVLRNGIDYTVNYSNNINAGTGKVIVMGKGNYTGTQSTTFTISKINIDKNIFGLATLTYEWKGMDIKEFKKRTSDGTFSIKNDKYMEATYLFGRTDNITTIDIPKGSTNFSSIKLVGVTLLKDSGKEIKEGTDYMVTYSDFIENNRIKIKITGKGNYQGVTVLECVANDIVYE